MSLPGDGFLRSVELEGIHDGALFGAVWSGNLAKLQRLNAVLTVRALRDQEEQSPDDDDDENHRILRLAPALLSERLVDWLLMTPFQLACLLGHLNVVQWFLQFEEGVIDVNNGMEDDMTPLHVACANGHSEVAEFLLENDAFVNALDRYGSSPLSYACMLNAGWTVVNVLLEHGAAIDILDEWDGFSALHYCCYVGADLDSCLLLLEEGADPNQPTEQDGWTPLHCAVSSGNAAMVDLLLSMPGIETNIFTTHYGGTRAAFAPLHVACEQGHVEIARLLLEHGPAEKLVNQQLAGDDDIMCRAPLHCCADAPPGRDLEIASLLIEEYGADVNLLTCWDETPLMNASFHKGSGLVRYLLEHGAHLRMNLNQEENGTALHQACTCAKMYLPDQTDATLNLYNNAAVDTIFVLIEYGVDVNAPNECEQTPLQIACSEQGVKMGLVVQALIEAGANVKAADSNFGCTPLHGVCAYSHPSCPELARLLLERDPSSIHAVSFCGFTPLHEACISASLEVIQVLVEKDGSSMYHQNNSGMLALHCACSWGRIDVARFLVEKHRQNYQDDGGVPPSSMIYDVDDGGRNPLHFAFSQSRLRFICQILKITRSTNHVQEPLHELSELLLLAASATRPPLLTANGSTTSNPEEASATMPPPVDCLFAPTKSGITPLHIAISLKDPNAIQLLLRHGALRAANQGGPLDAKARNDLRNLLW